MCHCHIFAAIFAVQNHSHRGALHLYQASSSVILHRPVLFQILFGPPRIKNKNMNTTSKASANITLKVG